MTAQQASEERVAVNAVDFVRAETDTYLDNLLRTTGALGVWHHSRRPTPVDEQTVIRMSRDTLYSTVVLDVSEGAAVTLPDADGRYRTAMVVDQDHFAEKVLDRPGTHYVSPDEVGSAYIAVAVLPSSTLRTRRHRGRGRPAGRARCLTRTDPVKHLLGTAFGWGGLPHEQAHYFGTASSSRTTWAATRSTA